MEEAQKKIVEIAKKENVKLIELQFSDIFGVVKSVTIPAERLEDALEKGVWFDGSSIQGFTRIYESDMYLKLDESTYSLIPWKHDTKIARIICDVYMPDGKPFEGDPRHILRTALKEAKEMGFVFNTGPELEFFLFQKMNGEPKPMPQDNAGYFDFAPRDLAGDVRKDIIFGLQNFGMNVEASHHEVAEGQHEIDFRYGDALISADRVITFKFVAKSIAQMHELYASFMPKPIFGASGSGMHVHQSLFDIKKGKNAFYDADDKYKLSQLAKHFIAGQLKHAAALTAIVAPTVNSYKRLVSGYEAPVYICWGQINRSALIRIPRYSPGREEATRAELRCPDPSCNPYLAFAAMLKAGLDGIKNKTALPEPVEENVYHFDDSKLKELNISMLPGSLSEAIAELEKDRVILESLGKHSGKEYLLAKKAEWDSYRMSVSEWELKRYLNTI